MRLVLARFQEKSGAHSPRSPLNCLSAERQLNRGIDFRRFVVNSLLPPHDRIDRRLRELSRTVDVLGFTSESDQDVAWLP